MLCYKNKRFFMWTLVCNTFLDKNELEPKDGSVPNSAVQQHLNILNPIAITDVHLNRIWTIPSVAQQELQTSCVRINADFIRD